MQGTPEQRRRFQELRRAALPPVPVVRNAFMAFAVGGAICAAAEVLLDFLRARGLPFEQAATLTSAAVVAAGAILTGLGVYDEVVRVGGMGGALPVSGFANSIVSPAMEFKREGWVLGLGAKMFVVAGPVLVYGLLTSFAVGAVYLLRARLGGAS